MADPSQRKVELLEKIEHNFTYHPPDADQAKKYEALRAKAKELALEYAELVPPGREQALAFTALEESVFWANAGIARAKA